MITPYDRLRVEIEIFSAYPVWCFPYKKYILSYIYGYDIVKLHAYALSRACIRSFGNISTMKFPQIVLKVAKSRQAGDNIRIFVTMAARS